MTLVSAAMVLGIPCSLVVLIPGIRAVRRTAAGTIVGPPLKDRSSVTAAETTDN